MWISNIMSADSVIAPGCVTQVDIELRVQNLGSFAPRFLFFMDGIHQMSRTASFHFLSFLGGVD